jgi:hypothetical protein
MRAEEEFHLQPHRMVVAAQTAVVVVPLQPELRKLGRVESEIRRQPKAIGAVGVVPEGTLVAGYVLTTEPGDPPPPEP